MTPPTSSETKAYNPCRESDGVKNQANNKHRSRAVTTNTQRNKRHIITMLQPHLRVQLSTDLLVMPAVLSECHVRQSPAGLRCLFGMSQSIYLPNPEKQLAQQMLVPEEVKGGGCSNASAPSAAKEFMTQQSAVPGRIRRRLMEKHSRLRAQNVTR
ncbi:hypothetical protein EYF80_031137 [Liparis tanakae]|uniref:Uncharacterized protein n=1 Tax=Liparis tanakae TaxID=230148 RepID=A0A4Z2H1D0_9TELE|nr:hypothetical protein EYF80_031137 [Liparis tanakae]